MSLSIVKRGRVAGIRGPGLTDEDKDFLTAEADRAEAAADIAETYSGEPTVRIAEQAVSPASPARIISRDYVAGSTYVVEVIVAAADDAVLSILSSGNIGYNSKYDLETGIPGDPYSEMTDLGGGFYRCVVEKTAGTTHTTFLQIGAWRKSADPPYSPGVITNGINVERVREYEDGVLTLDHGPDELLVSPWVSQASTATLDEVIRYDDVLPRLAMAESVPTADTASKPLSGLRVTAFGSSITYRNPDDPTYASELALMSGIILTNRGISGGSLGEMTGSFASLPGNGVIYDELLELLPNQHAVLLECGPNDFYGCVPIGSLGDTTTATFYGALDAAIVRINAEAPNARICLLTPYGSGEARADPPDGPDYSLIEYSHFFTNAEGDQLWQFQKAIKDVGDRYGLRVIDVGGEGGIGWFTSGLYTTDRLHTNLRGAQKNATYVYGEMLDAYASGYFDSRILA